MQLLEFKNICSSNGIVLNDSQMSLIERYCSQLKNWNEKVNLISRKDTDNILDRHILHSLSILKYLNFIEKSKCLDIGTGGGLPGIPLAIARPDLKFLLVDSIGKKIKITSDIIENLGIHNTSVISARAKELSHNKQFLHSFDYIFTRSVAILNKILEWSKNLLKADGQIIAYKGGNLKSEFIEAQKKFPKFIIDEFPIKFDGYSAFEKDEKKILLCYKNLH